MKQFIGKSCRMLKVFMIMAFLVGALTTSAMAYYTITEIGTLPGGNYSSASCINVSGQVSGFSNTGGFDAFGNQIYHAFIYSAGTGMKDLGTLSGDNLSEANSINNSGQVTGLSTTVTSSGRSDAFFYSNGQMTGLGTLPSGHYSIGFGINNSGQITGWSDTGGGGSDYGYAFLYSNGKMSDLGTFPGGRGSRGMGINDSGQVTGESYLLDNQGNSINHAFLYSAETGMTDLGAIGDYNSTGVGINNSGQVTGCSDTGAHETSGNNIHHAFLYSAETGMTDLGTFGGNYSIGYAINNSGQVVGSSEKTDEGGSEHVCAFLYSDGQMIDLNTLLPPSSGWILIAAKGINDLGQIIGDGMINGKNSTFIMTPPSEVITVAIDIRPWNKKNPINYKGHGILPVAILSTETFDAPSQVDQGSLTFGATGDENSLAFCNRRPKDLNKDGSKDDLVCHFYIETAGFKCGDTNGILKGKTLSDIPIQGEDLVRIINCK